MRTVTVRLGSMSLIFLIACLLALLAPAATFAQDPVYTLTISGGDNQSAPIASAFTDPLQVTVTDESGVGVAGVVVTFNLPATGPGLYRVPYATSFTLTTDANGAASVSVTANSWVGGPYEVTAGIEGASVTFHLTNAPAADPNALASYWMADPLDPGQPAPAADTPPETAVPGWWWRDTTHQNALSQHTADQFTGQVIQVYADPARSLSVWVYSSRVGSNVTVIMTAHNRIVVGCGGGAAEATQARTAFQVGVPGFVTKADQGVILTDSRPDSYWGCKKWNPVRIYANSSFEREVADSQAAGVEKARRTAYADGRSLEWGPQGNVGLGWARSYNPTDPALRPPTHSVPDHWSLLGLGDDVYVALRPLSGDDLAVYLPPAIGDYSDPYRTYGSYSNFPADPESWGPHSGGAVLIAGDQAGRYLPDAGSIAANHAGATELWKWDLGYIGQFDAQRLVMEHGLPIMGPEAVYAALTAQRDALQYVHDQTLAGMNAGLTESEIAATVQLPPELAANPYNQELVSTIPGVVHDVYHSHIGWFGGETPELAGTLTTGARAQVLADLAGGTANLIAAARTAELNARDLAGAEKALYLAYAAYKAAPDDFGAKQVYAQALRKNAYLQKSAQIRNYYLSEALHLGAETIVTGFAKWGDENAVLAFSAAEFSQHFFGISGAALETVKIVTLPPAEHGVLALSGVPAAAGQEIPLAGLDGLTFTPAGDWNGETGFAWNGGAAGAYAAEDAAVTITIAPLNDAPLLSSPLPDVTVDEDAASLTIDLAPVFTDVDGDELSYSVESSNPALVSATLDAATLTLDFQAEQNGAATITVSAADETGQQAAAWATDDFLLTVNPVNDAPWANGQAELVTTGLARTFTLDYGDVEAARADLAVSFSGPSVGTLDTSALPSVTYTAPAGYIGPASFTYTVTDRGDPDGCTAAPCSGALQAQATVTLDVAENAIRGRAYNDANANSSPDEGETGVAGVTVRLTPLSGSPAVELVTGADGAYAFGSLAPGAYRVRQVLLPGYVQTTPEPADINLAMGQAVGGIDFGVVYSADLSVAMTADVNDRTVIDTFVVTNNGPAEALEAELINVRPHGVSYTTIVTTRGVCQGGNTVTCELGTLAAGESVTVTIQANRTDRNNPIENTVTVTASTFDIALSNNSATVTVQ